MGSGWDEMEIKIPETAEGLGPREASQPTDSNRSTDPRQADVKQPRRLLEVIDQDFFAKRPQHFLHKLDMHGVRLVFILRFLVGKHQIECHLVGLLNHRPRAANHPAGVITEHPWDGLQVAMTSRQEIIRVLGIGGISPKNDNV